MPAPATARDHRGFTIVEVMMAGAIMAFVLVTSITVIRRAVVILDSARTLAAAGQIMQSEIEKIRLKDWTVVEAYPDGRTTLAIDSALPAAAREAGRFVLERTIVTPAPDIRAITLTVSWRSIDGRPISRSQTTHYCRFGLYDYFFNSAGS